MTAERDNRILVYGGFALSLAIVIATCRPWNLVDHFMVGAPFGRDFVNFWLGGRLAIEGRLDLLVDAQGYNDLIAREFAHAATDWFIFSYPPVVLPLLAPFGALPFVPALVAWTALNLGMLVAATRLIAPDRWIVAAACLAPATTVMVTYGHFGGVLACLAIVAVTQAQSRPALAGLCLGLICVKPQFAAVLGVLMLLIGQWRAALWSAPFAGVLIGLSVLAFGLEPWSNYLAYTVPFQTRLLTVFEPDFLRNTVSLYAAGRLAGLSLAAAQLLQWAFGLAALAGTVFLVGRDGINPRTLTVLLLTVMAVLPYVQHYDLVIVTPALAAALFVRDAPTPFLTLAPATLLWLAPVASIPFGLLYWPLVNLVIAAVLAIALVGELRRRDHTAIAPA